MLITIKRRTATLALLCFVGQASAATINAQVQDSKTGDPLIDAVVVAIPEDPASLASFKGDDSEVVVNQIDKEFVDTVTAVIIGHKIQFPNQDEIRHHVYSFSATKNFEIPLYKGTPADPVLLDIPGEIILGCNIHDWMKGFIYVSESPYFAKSDASGQAVLTDLPAGKYNVEVWHSNLQGKPENTVQLVDMQSGTDSQALTFDIKQEKVWKAWRAPAAGTGSYN